MDYGDRQERAGVLVRAFRAHAGKAFPWTDREYTGEEIALEIEGMTEMGQSLVATGSEPTSHPLVLMVHKLASMPEFSEPEPPV